MFDQIGPVAVVPVVGPMFKAGWVEWFGGASTERGRARIDAAAADESIEAIFMLFDSGGGDVSGTDEFGEAVARAAAVKPVHAHADDGMMASAAYWVGSQATRVTASKTSDVGSIGVVASLLDISGALEEMGLVLHVVSTGPRKGLLAKPEVTEEALDYVAEMIDPLYREFLAAVKRGRGMPIAEVRRSADGSVWNAREALKRGLIDAVETRDEAFGVVYGAADKAMRAKRRAAYNQSEKERAEVLAEHQRMKRAAGLIPSEEESQMSNEQQKRAEKVGSRLIHALQQENPELTPAKGRFLRCPNAEIARIVQLSPEQIEAEFGEGADAATAIGGLLRKANEVHVQLRLPDIGTIVAETMGAEAEVAQEPEPEQAEPEPDPEPEPDADDLDALDFRALQAKCKESGLSAGGSADDLKARIREHRAEAEQAAAEQ